MFRRVFLEKSNFVAFNFARSSFQTKEALSSVTNVNKLFSTNKNCKHDRPMNANYSQGSSKPLKVNQVNVSRIFKESIKVNEGSIEELLNADLKKLNKQELIEVIGKIFVLKPKLDTIINNKNINAVFNFLVLNIECLDSQEFVTLLRYCITYQSNSFNKFKNEIEKRMDSFSADQISILVSDFRKAKLLKLDEYEEFKNYLESKVPNLKTFDGIVSAMFTFQKDLKIINHLDNQILETSSDLKEDDWIKLISFKSILRQRNVKINKASSFCLLNRKKIFELREIQTCLLSYSMLSHYDEQLFSRLLKDLYSQINNEILLNEEEFYPIILSIGVLSLRDTKLLNKICDYLISNKDKHSKLLLVNFITSCGNVNFVPENLSKLLGDIDVSLFNFEDNASCLQFLNLTISLCQLDKPNLTFIETVLNETFWKKILADDASKTFMPSLIKLLTINLYSLTQVNNYEGPTLPMEVNIMEYQKVSLLIGLRKVNHISECLKNYLPHDKCFKASLLMPYGIFIDAFMIVSKTGETKGLADFFNKETSEFEADPEKYYKIAFKFYDFADLTKISNKLNGMSKIQRNILNSLGYLTIPITFDEFAKAGTTFNQVKLIKDKIEIYSKHPSFVETYF